jgi:hypothetical protein
VLFHVAQLKGGGFVVTSADDGIQPVIAFSEGNSLVADANNPLWALINKDLSQRRDSLAVFRASPTNAQPTVAYTKPFGQVAPETEWAELLNDNAIMPLGVTTVSDLRVNALVQSHWGQGNVSGFWANYNCYNMYTPNAYPCGCVATAMAQIMRKHCYPTSSIPARVFNCSINAVRQPLTMIGGTYDWSNMMLTPDEGFDTAPSDVIRAAIGKICYDAGVSVEMSYTVNSSGSNSYKVPNALRNVFCYASACYNRVYTSDLEENIKNAILVNLDHGYPVYLEISDLSDNSHAVVADGYGYNNNIRYIHLNMGWNGGGNGGYQNAWYNVPTVDTVPYNFSFLDAIVYNIFPDSEKALVSGRVLSASGSPVASATVLVRDLSTGKQWLTLQTNSKGMYAFSWPNPGRWSEQAGICATDGINASYELPVTAYSSSSGNAGNVWGADVYLSEPAAYSLTLDLTGGANTPTNISVRVGANLPTNLTPPSRKGYIFSGFFDTTEMYWGTQYYDAAMNPLELWRDASIKVLYAHWEPIAVLIGENYIPYTWLDSFNLTGGYEYAAGADQDKDGFFAWQEYVAGTNPTNKLSAFQISDYSLDSLVWSPNLPDRIYKVFGKTNLSDVAESWTTPTNATHRFFRVSVELP